MTCHLYLDPHSSILNNSYCVRGIHVRGSDFKHATAYPTPVLSTSVYGVIPHRWPPNNTGSDAQSFSQPSLSQLSCSVTRI